MFYIGLYSEKHVTIFLSETIRLKSLDIWYVARPSRPLLSLSNYAPGAKIDPTPGVTRDMASYQQTLNKTQVSDLGPLGTFVKVVKTFHQNQWLWSCHILCKVTHFLHCAGGDGG